jgi:hypothetical protein
MQGLMRCQSHPKYEKCWQTRLTMAAETMHMICIILLSNLRWLLWLDFSLICKLSDFSDSHFCFTLDQGRKLNQAVLVTMLTGIFWP